MGFLDNVLGGMTAPGGDFSFAQGPPAPDPSMFGSALAGNFNPFGGMDPMAPLGSAGTDMMGEMSDFSQPFSGLVDQPMVQQTQPMTMPQQGGGVGSFFKQLLGNALVGLRGMSAVDPRTTDTSSAMIQAFGGGVNAVAAEQEKQRQIALQEAEMQRRAKMDEMDSALKFAQYTKLTKEIEMMPLELQQKANEINNQFYKTLTNDGKRQVLAFADTDEKLAAAMTQLTQQGVDPLRLAKTKDANGNWVVFFDNEYMSPSAPPMNWNGIPIPIAGSKVGDVQDLITKILETEVGHKYDMDEIAANSANDIAVAQIYAAARAAGTENDPTDAGPTPTSIFNARTQGLAAQMNDLDSAIWNKRSMLEPSPQMGGEPMVSDPKEVGIIQGEIAKLEEQKAALQSQYDNLTGYQPDMWSVNGKTYHKNQIVPGPNGAQYQVIGKDELNRPIYRAMSTPDFSQYGLNPQTSRTTPASR